MIKKLLIAGLLVSASASAWAQSGQLGANQIWGNPTSGGKNGVPANIGSFLTPGTGVTVTGTPKATIGLANQVTAAGPMGSATQTIVLTFNAQGQITAATLATIAPPFSAITGSLACSQEPARTGDVTAPAGSCVNTTVKVNGVAFGTSPSTDTVPVITAANTATYTAVPNCTSGGLQYTTSTHLFSCGAAGTGNVSTSGSPAANQVAIFASGTTVEGVSGSTGQYLGISGGVPTYQSGGWTLLNTLTASGTPATLSDTTSFTSSFSEYLLVFQNVLPATNVVTCEIQVQSGGSFQTTSYLGQLTASQTTSVVGQASTTYIPCSQTNAVSNSATGLGVSGEFKVFNPSSTTAPKNWIGQYSHASTGPNSQIGSMGGFWNSSAAITGFQALFSSGNITSGVIKVYGRL